MSLPVLLTSENLRTAAGGAFARGEAYWREGRVLSCVLDKDALDGLVRGTEEYRVRVTALSGTLVAHCTCPVREAVCKHAVALSLSFLAQRGAVLAPLREEGVSSASEGLFATRAELDRWAEAHHVKHALAVSAGGLLQDLAIHEAQRNGLRHVLGGLALRDVGSKEGAFRHVGARGRGLETALAEAAAAYLRQEADAVRLALTEEAARREHQGDALLAPLWGRLLEARRALRLHAVPRSRERRALESWSFEAAACALTWKERDRVVRGGPDYGTVSVSARLTFPGGGEGQWECNCAVRQRGCVHVLALVDTVLDLLSDTARLADARRLAEELLRPGWARALKELELFEEEAAKPRATVEVWWYIEHELGTLTVSPLVKKQTRRGTLSAGARMTAARLLEEHRESLSDADLRIAEHLVSWAPTSSRAAGTYPSRAFLSLAGHPRVALELRPEVPLEMKRVQLGFTALAADGHIRLEPSIEGERFNPKLLSALLRTFSLGEPLFTVEDQRGRCLLIDVSEEARRIWTVLEKHGDQFPPESHGQLLERLSRLEARLPLVVPQALKGRELQTELATVVRLRLLPDVSLELELLVRPGPGAPLYHPGVGPRDVLLSRGGERGYVRRQLLREEEHARAAIAPLPLSAAEEGPPFCFRMGETEAALELVAALQSPPAGVDVEWVDEKPVIAASAGPEALRVQVERKRDWFGLSGELKVEAGRLELAVLLDAARRQKRFVRVDAHRWVELSETLRQRLLAVADHSFVGKNRIELSPGAVPAISALRDAGAEVDAAPSWQLLTERLAASLSLKPKPPASLGTTLRDYQAEGHAWLSRVAAWGAGACLADDMGLGKTVQALAVLLDRARLGPALVLAPTSVAFNWVQELQRFAPGLRPVLYAEQAERMACLTKLRKSDVLIVSYGLLVRDAASLGEVQFATLVVDEAQALKNPSTRRARAARQLKAGFRIALSGTPLENHLGELWSLFAIVFPGLLGSWEQFRERFAAPIERGKEPEANAALARVLRPFLLRRTKQEVARELPSRTEIQVPVALSEEEWTLYEDARLAAVAEVSSQGKGLRDEQQRFQVLAALTRLRLLASHPRLYDAQSSVSSSKMRRLLELLEELKSEGHRALVFSQFTSHLGIVREELERAGFTYQYLDGATPAPVRAKRIQAFQEGQGDLFLISLKAGGTGINLTAADYVIHLDPWWNPAVEDQATDRAHRIGQTRPVTVYRLIARGTIEEQILSLHSDKRALVAGVLEGTNAAARLTTKDLLTLLAGGDAVRDMQGDEEEPGPRTVH